MPDSTAEALLADITENPDDDTPRLVYADWLDDHGDDARAEFIRTQVRRARMGETERGATALLRREKALLKQNPAWSDTGLGVVGEMRRGFLEHVACTPAFLVEHGSELFARFPIRSLALRAADTDLATIRDLVGQPWLHQVMALRILRPVSATNGIGDQGLALFASSKHLTRLRVLELYACGIQGGGVRWLASAAHWRLTELQLTWNPIGPTGAQALAQPAHLAGLTRLDLGNTRIEATGALALAESPHFRQVRALNLSSTRIQVAGLRGLTQSEMLASVEVLNLGRMKFAVRAAQLLARCPHLGRLRELNLNTNRLEDEGAVALASAEQFPNLVKLSLRGNRISLAGFHALAGSTAWPALTQLDAKGNRLEGRPIDEARGLFAKGVLKV